MPRTHWDGLTVVVSEDRAWAGDTMNRAEVRRLGVLGYEAAPTERSVAGVVKLAGMDLAPEGGGFAIGMVIGRTVG